MWDMDILQEKNINASVNTEESSFLMKIYPQGSRKGKIA